MNLDLNIKYIKIYKHNTSTSATPAKIFDEKIYLKLPISKEIINGFEKINVKILNKSINWIKNLIKFHIISI